MKALLATSAVALSLAACAAQSDRAPRATLDCPQEEQGLKRVSAAPDGKSCRYAAGDGAEIELRLVQVAVSAEATLAGIESELRKALAAPADAAAAPAAPEAPDASKAAADEAARVRAQAEADAATSVSVSGARNGKDEDWGVRVAEGDGDHARVDLPGIHVDARDEAAQVRIGPLHVDASEDGAEIRMVRKVRLKGESLSRERRGVSAMLLLTGQDSPAGYGYVGYEAGGPAKGPLAVALVKGHDKSDHDDLYDSVRRLVRRNGGI